MQKVYWTNTQCCQLSWIRQETQDVVPYLLLSRLEDEISQILAEVCHFFSKLELQAIKFQLFCIIWAIFMLALNIS